MPITFKTDIRRPSEGEFESLAYDVMACVFQVHNELGRFCDEKIYKRLVAKRFGNVETEVPVTVSFEAFSRTYFLDMLIHGCTIFELKAVERLAAGHRGQLLNYLLLTDLPRGKLVNVRPELIEHEFVNTTLRPLNRTSFDVNDVEFCPLDDADDTWRDFLIAALHDSEHRFEQHARRFLNHSLQPALHWVNVTRNEVRLKTLIREEG